MKLRRMWTALQQRLSRSGGRLVLAVLVLVLLYWNAHQWWQLRPGGKAPPQVPNAVICTHCGWQGWRVTERLPQRCPHCRALSVHFAGLCPRCKTWTPWSRSREELVFAQPGLFLDFGPAYFFPKCRECGAQTTPRGTVPVSRKPRLLKHGAPGAQGDKQ